MNTETVLHHALFQLSPRRSRWELLVAENGATEMLATGLLKPLVSHLKAAEEQVAQCGSAVRLEVEQRKDVATWFNKSTLKRFVSYVSSPEVLELAITLGAEMSQLEGAQKLYSQVAGDQLSSAQGDPGRSVGAPSELTKKELLRAINRRLTAVKQDLMMACARAFTSGFTLENVSNLLLFAHHFGAPRLKDACTKFSVLCQRRPELINHIHQHQLSHPQFAPCKDLHENLRSSSGSDMSIDEPETVHTFQSRQLEQSISSGSHQPPTTKTTFEVAFSMPAMNQQPKSVTNFVAEKVEVSGYPNPVFTQNHSSAEPSEPNGDGTPRRLSLKDRINFFESKQKEQAGSNASTIVSGSSAVSRGISHKTELRRLASDSNIEKSVPGRWSGASYVNIDLDNGDNMENENVARIPSSYSCLVRSGSGERGTGDLKDIRALGVAAKDNLTIPLSSHSEARNILINTGQVKFEASKEISVNQAIGVKGSLEKSNPLCMIAQDGATNQAVPLSQPKPSVNKNSVADWKENTDSKGVLEEQFQTKARDGFQNLKMVASTEGEQAMYRTISSGSQHQSQSYGGATLGANDELTPTTKYMTLSSERDPFGVKFKGRSDMEHQLKSLSGHFEVATRKIELLALHSQNRIFPGKSDGAEKKEGIIPLNEVQEGRSQSNLQGMKFQCKSSLSVRNRDWLDKESCVKYSSGISEQASVGRKANEKREIIDAPSPTPQQAELLWSLKGSQPHNAELQVKADELKKLFAAHELRVCNDQMTSSQGSKIPETQADDTSKVIGKRLVEAHVKENICNELKFDSTLFSKMLDNQESVHGMNKFSSCDDNRGKFYVKYMEKRDAKLKEESRSKRAQKEAKMKSMHDSLEHRQAEMKAKLAGSADKRYYINSNGRTEKLIYNNCHSVKRTDQIISSSTCSHFGRRQ